MRLGDDDEKRFFAHDPVVLRGLFRAHEVDEVRAALERLYAVAQSLPGTGDHDGAFFVVDVAPPGPAVVRRIVWAGGAEPVLLRLSEDPRLVEPVLALLGTDRCEQLLCQAHYKMPHDGVGFDWHQDIRHRDKGNGTWRDVTGRGSFVQTILLVDDMTEENGPLEFVRADALDRTAERSLEATSSYDVAAARPGGVGIDASLAVPVTGRAGDVLLFGPYAVHGSAPNRSTRPRRVLINGYAAPGANARVYPGRGACRTLPRAESAPGGGHE